MAESNPNIESIFTDVANAIREKKGTSETIYPVNFADEVASIPTGGDNPLVEAFNVYKADRKTKSEGWSYAFGLNDLSQSSLNYSSFNAFRLITNFDSLDFSGSEDITKFSCMFQYNRYIQSAPLFDTSHGQQFNFMFSGCTNLTYIPDYNLSSATNINSMFQDCTSLESVTLTHIGTTSTQCNAGSLFRGCTNLKSVSMDTSHLTSTNLMFSGCYKLETFPTDFSNVQNAESMFTGIFSDSSKAYHIPTLNFSSATTLKNAFSSCAAITEFNQIITSSALTSTQSMFYNETKIVAAPLFETSNVTTMGHMFQSCGQLVSVPLYNTHNVTSMDYMFSGCYSLTSVPAFDTSNVTNMNEMFSGCYKLQTLPVFDTSNVTNMSYMLAYCDEALTEVPAWNVEKVTNFSNMFKGRMYYTSHITSILMYNISASLDISITQLEHDALVTLIGNLSTVESTQILTMGSTKLAKLSEEEKAIATNKGWTLA